MIDFKEICKPDEIQLDPDLAEYNKQTETNRMIERVRAKMIGELQASGTHYRIQNNARSIIERHIHLETLETIGQWTREVVRLLKSAEND